MKPLQLLFSVLLLLSFSLSAQMAEVQVIHNAADPGADTVDIYANGTILINDFAFRTATPFVPVPANVPIRLNVAPSSSLSVADSIAGFTVVLAMNTKYVVVANGVLNPPSFSPNPDGLSIGFSIYPYAPARSSSLGGSGQVDFITFHGSSDAPSVDVDARGVGNLVNNLSYGSFSPSYIGVPEDGYILDVKDSTGSVTVASFYADLNGLGGGAAVVFASGFLNPGQGPGFGIFAALPNGVVAAFPPVGMARVQVIHNAADPAADTVDVYANGGLLIDNFVFRSATPFVDVMSNIPLTISVAPSNSSSVTDAIASFPIGSLTTGEKYIVVANGVLNPGAFTPNPDALDISFALYPYAPAREVAMGGAGTVDFIAFHGSSDAPFVDVSARGVGTLIDNLSYGSFSNGYLTVPPLPFTLDVKDSSGSVNVASFTADLTGLSGGSAVIFASGFLDASQGQTFGLFAALPNGAVAEFPAFSCPTPINLSAQVSPEKARLSWDQVSDALKYAVRVRNVNDTIWNVLPTLNNVRQIRGLSAGQSYVWQVASICSPNGMDQSAWSASDTFSTTCMMPVNTFASNISFSSATLNWEKVIGALGYEIRGREVGTISWRTLVVGNFHGSRNVFSLAPSTTYEWQLRAWCDANGNNISVYSTLDTFTTNSPRLSSGDNSGEEILEMDLFPNPASGSFSIRTSNNLEQLTVEIFTTDGKLLHSEFFDLANDQILIRPDGLENGIYHVKLNTKGKQINKRLVIVK